MSLNAQSQILEGIVHTSTNRLEEKVNFECNRSWESDGRDSIQIILFKDY